MYVWYLSYGSNINTQRFHTYILGGQFNDTVSEEGCRNKDLPIAEKNVTFNHDLYFAGKFSKWDNQGVAFIKQSPNRAKTSFGKMYLIEVSQFEDVVKQENNMTINDPLDIDYAFLSKNHYYDLNQDAYGKLLQIGKNNDIPIYTFTSPWDRHDYNAPSVDYLDTILQGIEDSHHESRQAILHHFNAYAGINDIDCNSQDSNVA